ncbi:LysR family transcriptional regulator [Lyngbya confervoides]|uniref:LysR family transcriptional regulator n=1 Tax=Lyngbya confervoides BDU141951 TaxID=1574623 RepID=A0ABD4T3V8_9CYAN|nr:LysR family transcriptional regulator [Lyngbya confervoides]MCM1983111.1 LysR family transcriptional regulator [Lyngbya confervoides BDU141951]
MELFHLKVFETVVRAGSFSHAALELGISQSAVSRAIASLEDELRVCLLSRGRFGARPTRLGERVLHLSQQILDLRQQIETEVDRELKLQGGRVRLASFRSAATHLLPPLIAHFSQRFPGVEISLQEADPQTIVRNLRQSDVDIGIIPLPRQTEDLDIWEIARDEFVALLPKAQTPIPDPLSWGDLNRYTFILLNYAECTTVVQDHWKNWGQTLRVGYQITQDSTIVSMVSQGLGAAILPKLAALPIPENVCIRSLPVPLERRIGAAIVSQAMHSPAVLTFWNMLRDVMD